MITVHYSRFSVHCLQFNVYRSLFIDHCSMITVHWSLFSVYCSLFTVHCSQITVHCSLSTFHCSLINVHSLYRHRQRIFYRRSWISSLITFKWIMLEGQLTYRFKVGCSGHSCSEWKNVSDWKMCFRHIELYCEGQGTRRSKGLQFDVCTKSILVPSQMCNQFSGQFLSPRVFSAYYALLLKSCQFLTLINAFLHLWRKN